MPIPEPSLACMSVEFTLQGAMKANSVTIRNCRINTTCVPLAELYPLPPLTLWCLSSVALSFKEIVALVLDTSCCPLSGAQSTWVLQFPESILCIAEPRYMFSCQCTHAVLRSYTPSSRSSSKILDSLMALFCAVLCCCVLSGPMLGPGTRQGTR